MSAAPKLLGKALGLLVVGLFLSACTSVKPYERAVSEGAAGGLGGGGGGCGCN